MEHINIIIRYATDSEASIHSSQAKEYGEKHTIIHANWICVTSDGKLKAHTASIT